MVGVSNEYPLEARRSDGVLRIRRDVEKLPVHPEEADAHRRRFEWMERQPAYQPPEGEWLPSTMPPFRGIEVDSDGRIWVRRNTHPIQIPVDETPGLPPPIGWAQPFVYDVFEADGTFLGQVRLPERFEPHLFGAEYVWGVRRGDFDEEICRAPLDTSLSTSSTEGHPYSVRPCPGSGPGPRDARARPYVVTPWQYPSSNRPAPTLKGSFLSVPGAA